MGKQKVVQPLKVFPPQLNLNRVSVLLLPSSALQRRVNELPSLSFWSMWMPCRSVCRENTKSEKPATQHCFLAI